MDDWANSTEVSDEPVETAEHQGVEVGCDTATDLRLETEMQVEEAGEALQNIPELQPEVWQQLDAGERLEALRQAENTMAEIQDRPAVPVASAEIGPGLYGGFTGDQIQVNAEHLTGDEVPAQEFVDTIVHEGRHAYQAYAIENPGFVSDEAAVASWADNWQRYYTEEEVGPEEYRQQPLEADAWSYAEDVTNRWWATRRQ